MASRKRFPDMQVERIFSSKKACEMAGETHQEFVAKLHKGELPCLLHAQSLYVKESVLKAYLRKKWGMDGPYRIHTDDNSVRTNPK